MGEKEHSLVSQKQELLKKRKQLLDIKLQLQKDIDIAKPINFGSKYGTLSEAKILSIADGLQHRFSDVRFLEKLECHLLCGLKIINYNESKLVVQFRPSYLEKILPEVYAISLLAGNNGYSIEKYYLPLSVQIQPVVQQWSPLKQDNLKHFLLDIKQQINAFHHRQNQILQLKDWANNKNITLKVFHPLSLNYIIITARADDNLKPTNCGSLSLVFTYDSNCYLPTTVDVESSELEEEELDAAKEQFLAFKVYYLKEAFEICFIKTERFSLPANEDVQNENSDKEDNKGTSISKEEEEISDLRIPAKSEQHENFGTLSQVNKENRLLPTVEQARKSKSKYSTKGKRNKHRDNHSSSDEKDISELSTSDAPKMMEEGRKSKSKYSAKGKRNKHRDNRTSSDEKGISQLSTSDAPEMMEEGKRNRNTDDVSEKTSEFKLQLETKRSLGSVLQKAKKSKSKISNKETKNIASKHENNIFQTKKKLNTDRKVSKKKYSPDDALDDILHTKKKKSPRTHSTDKPMNEVTTPPQTNKITRYFLRSER